jgi:hypothetical protein
MPKPIKGMDRWTLFCIDPAQLALDYEKLEKQNDNAPVSKHTRQRRIPSTRTSYFLTSSAEVARKPSTNDH